MIFGLSEGEKKRVAEMVAAARVGDTEKVKQLLAKGVDINASEPESGDTPLLAAIDGGQWATAEYLLTQRPDLTCEDNNGNSPLYLTALLGDSAVAMATQLLDAGAPVELGPRTGDNAGATPLHICCATGANECLEALLAHGASATKLLPDGSTPLHSAAIGGDQRTVELLCKAGGNITAPNNEKRTPLHNCGSTGNAEVAAALIQQGAAVDSADVEGCTPLMRAVLNNHAEVARVLLDHGANPDVMVQAGDTLLYPLLVAALNGHDEIVRVLLDKGVNVTAKAPGSASPVDAAKHNGHEASARMIAAAIKKKKAAEKDATTDAKDAEALWRRIVQAVAQKDPDGLRTLVNEKLFASLSVDARLLTACALGDAKIARDMLRAGADPTKPCKELFDGATPLVMTFAVSRSVEVASLLIDAGANVNDEWRGATPIFETTADQFYDLAKLLVTRGADVNVRMGNGLTPLMFAARNGAARCVDLFLDSGADINAVEEEHGIGAFGLALNEFNLQLAEHLLARGAEPNFGSIETLPLTVAEHGSLAFIHALEARGCKLVQDGQRGRMAFVAARNPDPEVFDYLLNQGADPSEGNDFGYTPLILAALNNHHHLIRRYLVRGDDAAVRDVDGETALSLAIEKRHEESIAVLREFNVEEGDYSELESEAAMLKAAEDGALGSILNLRDFGVPVNCCDGEGNSAIMIAARADHHGVVRSLYHLGADINHSNYAAETALSLAKASDSTDIVNTLQEFGALDAATGELGNLSAMFGSIPTYNAADTMFGRMSHPYKDKSPYDNEAADGNDALDENEDDDDNEDDDEFYEDGPDESSVGESIESKLDLLSQLLDSDQVIEQSSEAVLELLAQKLDYWRSLHEESELDDDELAELNHLLSLLDLGESKEAVEIGKTPLLEAIHAQDISAVRTIITGGGDVNEVNGEGDTPLMIAVLTRNENLVEELLKLGADPNKARPDGTGPLFGAVLIGEEKIIQTLIKGGSVVDSTLSVEHSGTPVSGCTALYVAAFVGHLPSCKSLISSGASIDAANDLGYTPLMAAIQGDHEDVIDFFLENGANVNPEVIATMEVEGLWGASLLNTATLNENLGVIKQLLKRGVHVNRPSPNGWTPLKSAAQLGNLEIVRVLLEAGADPNIADDTNYTPLMNAVSGEHEDLVKILLKFKADPNVQSGENPEDEDWEPGRSALMEAAASGNVAIARELLKAGANPNLLNSKGRTALHSAVVSANTDMVSLLLKFGADPNVFGNDEEKMSALDLALRLWVSKGEDERIGGISDVLDLMLKKGMPNDRSSLDETALDLVVDLFGEQGILADANALGRDGNELFKTVAWGDDLLQAAEVLVKIGADVNYKSPGGLSVLSVAARNGAVRQAELLLNAGANVMDRTSFNDILAYDLAVIYGHDELVDLLIAHMNQVVSTVDRQADDGTTALMRATMAADVKMIKDLLAAGADASRRDRQGESPLSFSVTHDMGEVVKTLRSAGVEKLPDDKVRGPQSIVYAGGLGALGTILDLLDSGVPIDVIDDDGETALTAAVCHPGVVKVLAKRGADLTHRNGEGKTAYMIAATFSRVRMVEVLKNAGSPIDEPEELVGDTITDYTRNLSSVLKTGSDGEEKKDGSNVGIDGEDFLRACLNADALAVSTQIAAGTDVNYEDDRGLTPLLMALTGLEREERGLRRERDFEQIIDSLLVAGADPNQGCMPALLAATTTGRLHLVNAMLRAGADIDAATELQTDEKGGTILVTALFAALSPNRHGGTFDDRVGLALLEAGPDLFFTSYDGSMAVHFAANSGMSKVLNKILDLAPEVIDAQNEEGSTPLILAAAGGHVDAINSLLKRGASLEIRDAKGRSAAQIAQDAGHQQAGATLA